MNDKMEIREIKLFAEKVERLCKVLAEQMKHNPDREAIIKLQDEAANIASVNEVTFHLSGIAEALR